MLYADISGTEGLGGKKNHLVPAETQARLADTKLGESAGKEVRRLAVLDWSFSGDGDFVRESRLERDSTRCSLLLCRAS
jgi:hypothetical protein